MSYNKTTNMYEGYIYKIYNDINNKLYIGKTSVSIKRRWAQHKYTANMQNNNHIILYNAMNKYGIANFHIELLETVSHYNEITFIDILNDKEIYYIEHFNTITPNGYNITIGGEGVRMDSLLKPVDAYFADGTFDRSYDAINDVFSSGDYDKAGNASSISLCCRGLKEYALGRVWRFRDEPFDKYPVHSTQEKMNRLNNCARIDQYTTNGEFVATYNSMTEACIVIGKPQNYGTTAIAQCCRGKLQTAFEFIWRYHGDPFDKYDMSKQKVTEPTTSLKPVNKYDTDDNFIEFYNSIREAERLTNISVRNILRCCNKTRKTTGSFKWFYADDPDQPDKSKIITSN